MVVYLVEGTVYTEVSFGNFIEQNVIYGIFSSKEKAMEIANNLKKRIFENNEQEEITTTELAIDEPTNDYYFMTQN